MSTKQILQQLQDDILRHENLEYYRRSFEDGNYSLTNQLDIFISTGQLFSEEINDVIFNALSNIFEVTIVLLNANNDKDCYFLAEEKNYIVPRMKISHETICVMFDGDLFHALLHKDEEGIYNCLIDDYILVHKVRNRK